MTSDKQHKGIELKDILHVYLGCEVQTPDGIGKLHSVSLEAHGKPSSRVKVFFGRIVATKNCIGGGYDKRRNYGDYNLTEERYEPLKSKGRTEDGFNMPGGVIPILRPLTKILPEDTHAIADELDIITDNVFLWIRSGLQGNITTFSTQVKFINALRKRGYDCDGLIESNQAIDKTLLP